MPLYEKVLDTLLTQIKNGTLPEGTLLPTELELCSAYGVSRTTVRTALQKLQLEGMIKRVKGKGTIVTRPQVLENSTIFVESFSEELRTKGFRTTTEVLEFRRTTPPAPIAAFFGTQPTEQALKLTRLRYQSGAFDEGSIVLTTNYLPPRLSFVESYNLEQTSLHAIFQEHGLHRSDITKSITARELDAREARLLGAAPSSIAILIISHVLDQEGRPLDVCESIYPVGRNSFTLHFKA